MGFLQNAVFAVFIFLNTFVSGALGFFHLASTAPLNTTVQSSFSTTSNKAQPIAASLAGPLWIPLSQSEATTSPGWFIQNGLVVYQGAMDSGGNLVNRIVQIDPNTFLVSASDLDFGKDNSNVYYDGALIGGSDPNSFTVLGAPYDDGQHNGDYAKDKLSAYYQDSASSGTVTPIPGADVATFVSIGYGYAKDNRFVYLFGDVISAADQKTFVVLGLADSPEGSLSGDTYAEDRTHVFLNGNAVSSNVDVGSFSLIRDSSGEPTSYAKDKSHVYNAYDCTTIDGADPATFTVLNTYYAKDKYNVYSFDGPGGNVAGTSVALIGADPATFQLVSGASSYDATDGRHKYNHGWPVD